MTLEELRKQATINMEAEKEFNKQKRFNTFVIMRGGNRIAQKTYSTLKSANQLRSLAINYMVNHDISTKYYFNIGYELI